eukprot:GHVS01051143.1.p1 GENE.GHVS01051143.1~~GHVS01051143.1.p1  ORF type:complete len:192 (+),score=9.16 GHVS01051143.1:614-1189(+)
MFVSLGLFCSYFVEYLLSDRSPPTISLYWSLLSVLPCLMTAVNLYMFHMSYLSSHGMSRQAAVELSRIIRLILIMVVISFLTLSICSVIQQALCPYCSADSTAGCVGWIMTVFFMMIATGMSAPSRTRLNELVRVFEQNQVAFGGASMTFTSTHRLRDPSSSSLGGQVSAGAFGPAAVVAGKVRTLEPDDK